ncbi:hypothetical protein MalM25_09640 [Planctomycetes bacterium MalM25]|nr:hypothetical protein MalM25_09640 [Planctomycetes bacterium MalM25]
MSQDVTLPLRAENNPKFYSRFKWLGLAALGFMAYCLYDGLVTWPDQMERGQTLYTMAEETLSESDKDEITRVVHEKKLHGHGGFYQILRTNLSDYPELETAWKEKAAEAGWDEAPPAKLRAQGDIYGQYIMAGISLLGAIYFLTTVLRTNGRWFELNENGVDSRWGESFSLDQVTAIEKKQWRDKGIARVRYKDEGGRARTFVVDNYKYHRKTTDRILWRIENAVGIDKIVGGKPGPDPDAAPQAAPAPAEAAQS